MNAHIDETGVTEEGRMNYSRYQWGFYYIFYLQQDIGNRVKCIKKRYAQAGLVLD